jgi:two-component system, chemotaxis family, sensor kinase Cph1
LASRPLPMPAFGQADLSNCEREQIQLPGSIQPHGALLVVSEPDYVVFQASANAAGFLGLSGPVIGLKLGDIPGDLCEGLHPHLGEPLHAIPIAVRCRLGTPPREYDGLLRRPPEGGLIIELEPAGSPVDLSRHVENAVQSILSASSLRMLCDETARIFEDLTGYDRVMVYRFDDDGHGEVFSEQRKPHLEAYLGNRYPASDIPQIARRLYERNRVRLLVDVDYVPSPLTPRLSPLTGRDLDMSLCFLRSMSPIHMQYLKNMGVRATLVVSVLVGGRLWGLIACHHYVPRFVHFEMRAVCELLAEAVGTRITALESFVQAQSELTVRRIEQRMVEAITRDGDWRSALFDGTQSLLQPVGATGAALIYDGQIFSVGEVPGTQEIRAIAQWLDTQPRELVLATAALGLDAPQFASIKGVAGGLMATPLASSGTDYLLWFRPERVRTVTWGGDPHKPVVIGNDPPELSPRRSFAQWHQLVEGTADPWTRSDLTASRLIGDSVADVALQFRSVGMLIAQDQLESVSRQVRQSDQPVVIADASGRILLTNEAFERLMRPGHPHLTRLDDLARFFAEPLEFRASLSRLLKDRRPWRAEVGLEDDAGVVRMLMLRADPVFATPERVLGFVFLFTDVTERKAAETARRRFQEGLIERPRFGGGLDLSHHPTYQNLLGSIVENAQLAALEITYGAETANMKGMLESVRASVTRSSELLQNLIWHASKTVESSDDKT